MVEVMVAVVVAALGVAVLVVALPLIYGIARLRGPHEAYPDCWRLLRMVARPE
jgi:hypothetical protein